jgi:ubiquitin-like 1-activating enzyme E1 B
MSDMWRSRSPPTPLVFDKIRAGTFVLPQRTAGSSSDSNGHTNGVHVPNGRASAADKTDITSKSGLKDQKTLTIEENLALFISR